MALLLHEKLIDLGPHGLLALTIGDAFAMPLPVQLFGYARWHDQHGAQHDRLDLCTRRLSRAIVNESLAQQRAKNFFDNPSVSGRIAWCAKHVSDDYTEAPTAAAAFGGALVLLVFAGVTGRAVLRIIDVVAGSVVYEETSASLCARLEIKPLAYHRALIDQPLVHAAGSGHILLTVAHTGKLLSLKDGALEPRDIPGPINSSESAFCANGVIYQSAVDGVYQIAWLGTQGAKASFTSGYNIKAHSPLAGAAGADRFAISHGGGTVEVIDGHGGLVGAYRPYPRAASNEGFAIGLSFFGRYLFAACDNGAWVIDLADDTVAPFVYPPYAQRGERTQFSPEVIYQAGVAVTDEGIFTLAGKGLTHVPFARLDWAPVTRAGQRYKRAGSAAAYRTILPALVKPALALKAIKSKGASASFMYGLPVFPEDVAWPEHAGHRMQLLCQLDLGDAAALLPGDTLPSEGRLLFFVSVDEQGALAEDDEMAPQAVRVLWLPPGQAQAGEGTISHPSLAAKPVRLVRERSELPQPDAAIVAVQLLSDIELEEYRAYFEHKLPDGISRGNRLGGYPAALQGNAVEAHAAFRRDGEFPARDPAGWQVAARWRLLMQFESDQFMWGTDSGILYFMIHEDDLQRRDFSGVIGICAGL